MRLLAIVWILGAAATLGCTSAADSVTSPTTDPQDSPTSTFESVLYPDGSATRSVLVEESGTIVVTLDTVSPPARVGLALGLARSDGAGCYLTASLEAAETPAQLTSPVDAGRYCVHVFDVGDLAGEVAFTVTITTP